MDQDRRTDPPVHPTTNETNFWRGTLAADSMVLPVPAGLDPIVATLFNPLGAGIRWG
ncbi:alcohol dehydrogenase GroES domain protein [Mycobacterium xenopi 4042]|uniref:Alcohol dehydrogenase GroES domain protein n=1 Tax=Mycobacterium xenopi 4042 TaxID=1299334 RepID=X8DLK9_MYCXE|nr:alcohol dehydrogenase GroES domain protein [Mycobacterium xenopi 4042]